MNTAPVSTVGGRSPIKRKSTSFANGLDRCIHSTVFANWPWLWPCSIRLCIPTLTSNESRSMVKVCSSWTNAALGPSSNSTIACSISQEVRSPETSVHTIHRESRISQMDSQTPTTISPWTSWRCSKRSSGTCGLPKTWCGLPASAMMHSTVIACMAR
jgi:hypothetical protein